MSGKGDTYRPVNMDKFSKNYDNIFRKKVTRLNNGTLVRYVRNEKTHIGTISSSVEMKQNDKVDYLYDIIRLHDTLEIVDLKVGSTDIVEVI